MNHLFWSQFGAAIDMLDNAIAACPEDLWGAADQPQGFWYLAYHTLFYLDFYLADSEADFAPPAPFTLSELNPAGMMPDRVYTRAELRSYLQHGRRRCRAVLAAMTAERGAEDSGSRKAMTRWELILYNLRHVQHHAAQLNMLLRQHTDAAPGWLSRAPDPLLPQSP